VFILPGVSELYLSFTFTRELPVTSRGVHAKGVSRTLSGAAGSFDYASLRSGCLPRSRRGGDLPDNLCVHTVPSPPVTDSGSNGTIVHDFV